MSARCHQGVDCTTCAGPEKKRTVERCAVAFVSVTVQPESVVSGARLAVTSTGNVRRVRSVVTGALEIERAAKRIGSSLEAAPIVHVTDHELGAALAGVDMAEVCITSAIRIVSSPSSAGAFTLPDVPGIAVVPARAEGKKCARSWRITTDVGSDPAYPELSARDAAAMRELDTA